MMNTGVASLPPRVRMTIGDVHMDDSWQPTVGWE